MNEDRRTTVGVLTGLLTLALPRAASAQQPPVFNPNAPGQVPSLPPSALPPAAPPPSALPSSKVPSAASSPRDAASQKAVSEVLGPMTRSRTEWQVFELADGGILLVESGRTFRVDLRAAADGLYDLSRSGTIAVQDGRAAAVNGRPGAVMAPAGLP